jgi:hypothetical protein
MFDMWLGYCGGRVGVDCWVGIGVYGGWNNFYTERYFVMSGVFLMAVSSRVGIGM